MKSRSRKKVKKILRVGTDCSGIEAPIQALQQLKIPFRHIFSSEIDKYCIQSIKANYNPEIIFGDVDGDFPNGDITERNIKDIPDIDLYICGFPCQAFSIAGKRKGFKDKRGNVFFSCLDVIEYKQPKYFILENVKGILNHDKGKTWEFMWNSLLDLKQYGYNIYYNVLNTKDYGIPQNRERLFIIGCKHNFEWPTYSKMKNIKDYVDWNDDIQQNIPNFVKKSNLLKKIPKNSVFIDTGFQYFDFPYSDIYCPCLTSGHSSNLWCVPLKRLANVNEWCWLQGFKNFTQVVSKTQIKKQFGNSISVNVLMNILKNLL